MKQKNEHLINNIPNNFFTRWIVKKINKRMTDSNSRYVLVRRYRKPLDSNGNIIHGCRDGGTTKELGSVFSIYARARRDSNGYRY